MGKTLRIYRNIEVGKGGVDMKAGRCKRRPGRLRNIYMDVNMDYG